MTIGEPRNFGGTAAWTCLKSRLRGDSGVLVGFTAEVAEGAEKNQCFCFCFPIFSSAHSAPSAVNQLNDLRTRPS